MRIFLLVLSMVCAVSASPVHAQSTPANEVSNRRSPVAGTLERNGPAQQPAATVASKQRQLGPLEKLELHPPGYLELIAPLLTRSADPKPATDVPAHKPLIAQASTDQQLIRQARQTQIVDESKSEAQQRLAEQDQQLLAEQESSPSVAESDATYDYLGDPLDPAQLISLRDQVRRTLIHYHDNPESANERSPWGVMHALIGFGVDTDLIAGRQKVNAIGWLCWNGQCNGQRLLTLKNGGLTVNVGPGVQGHTGQFLAMLAQSRVPADFEIRVGGKVFTVADLIDYEKATCRPKTELTFKLIGLSHYLPSDAEWTSDDGQSWSISRLIEEELAQPVIGAACGGTHRLTGLTYAVANRLKDEKPIEGEWKRAQIFLTDFQEYTLGLQNPDGSFSTKWFERREAKNDSQRRVQTTGHILEWLVVSLPEEQLRSPEIVKAVEYLSGLLDRERRTDWEIGPKGHAIHALGLYDQRVFGAKVGQGGPRLNWDEPATAGR